MKIQCVKRKKDAGGQWYVSLPASIVSSLELRKGEEVEWQISDINHLTLCRKKENKPEEPGNGKQEKKRKQVFSMSFLDFMGLLGV
jgi:hypothetical protein